MTHSRNRAARRNCLIATLVFFHALGLAVADTFTGISGGSSPLENRQPTLAIQYIIALQGIFPSADRTPHPSQPPDRTDPFLGEIRAVAFDSVVPRGWAFCNGQLLLINQYGALYALIGNRYGGDNQSTFALPDLQGRIAIGAGQGTGLPNYDVGDVVGISQPSLTDTNLPYHTHTLPGGGTTGPVGTSAPFDNRQASIALTFFIAPNGEIMIVSWVADVTPTDWLPCDGRLLNVIDYPYLFNNIGNTYGGDGRNTFALPDLLGRTPLGDDRGTSWPSGLRDGSNDVVLTLADMPKHTHSTPDGNTGFTGGTGNTAKNYQPSLVMRWLIAYNGSPPSDTSSGYPTIGEMRLIAGPAADGYPASSWDVVTGQLISISQQNALFNVIGTTFGGDGQDTFALPDLRGTAASSEDSGGFSIGSVVGAPTLLKFVAQLAAHAHALVGLHFTSVQHFGGGSITLTLVGTIGSSWQVDESSDLVTWTNLGTVNFNTPTKMITDPNTTHATKRFYYAHTP